MSFGVHETSRDESDSGSKYMDYDGIPSAAVRGSRGVEGKAVKAIANPLGHIEFDPQMFAGLFIETQSPIMQNRMMDLMMKMVKVWCDIYDTGIIDPELDENFNTIVKAAAIRDYLQARGMWND